MGHPPIEELLPKSNWSIYKLSRLAAKRAAQLATGKKPLVVTKPTDKTATIALKEIQKGMVVIEEVEKQFQPKEEAQEVAGKQEQEDEE